MGDVGGRCVGGVVECEQQFAGARASCADASDASARLDESVHEDGGLSTVQEGLHGGSSDAHPVDSNWWASPTTDQCT
eukprot:8079859-Pyramimonas_sp.AAC.1